MRRAAAALALLAGLCLAQTPGRGVEAHLGRGAKLMQDQLFDAAAGEFEKALAIDPTDVRARYQYAVCLLTVGRNDEARHEFERVRKQAGELPPVTYYLGRLDLLANDYASAIKRLGSVAENPPLPDTAFYLGVAYISAGNVAAGTKWLERAVKLMPRDYKVHYRLARAYSAAGREQEASREYELYSRFRDEHKNTEKDVRACTTALRTEPRAAAREVCHRMYDPNDPDRLTLLGQLYGDAGAFNEALEPLQRAVRLDPASFEAWHNLGVTYFRLKRYREARQPLEKAVALRPEYYGSVVLLGATLYMLGDDEAALPVLEHAHRLNPGDAQTAAVLEKLRAARRAK
jgi:tetratricopeptide (TPR) repeat protein